jgi:hypothetical protein
MDGRFVAVVATAVVLSGCAHVMPPAASVDSSSSLMQTSLAHLTGFTTRCRSMTEPLRNRRAVPTSSP